MPLTIAAARGERSARIDLQLRISELFIADRYRTIALAEGSGRSSKRDRDMLVHLEAGRQNLIAAKQQISAGHDIPDEQFSLAA